jgi:hypothetical protein
VVMAPSDQERSRNASTNGLRPGGGWSSFDRGEPSPPGGVGADKDEVASNGSSVNPENGVRPRVGAKVDPSKAKVEEGGAQKSGRSREGGALKASAAPTARAQAAPRPPIVPSPSNAAQDRIEDAAESSMAEMSAPSRRYRSVGVSTLTHLRLVLPLAVAGAILGAWLGSVLPPRYTAEADLYVGKTYSPANTAAIPGLSAAATNVAGDYARLIGSQAAIANTESRLHSKSLGGSLSATQIPQSPEIRVLAAASTKKSAVALAGAGAEALITVVNQINAQSKAQLDQLLQQYAQNQQAINSNNQRIAQLNQSSSASSSQQIANLQTQNASLNLQAQALEAQYQNDFSPVYQDVQVISQLGNPHYTGSSTKKSIEIGGLAGAVGFLLIAIGIAVLTDIRHDRTQPDPPPA